MLTTGVSATSKAAISSMQNERRRTMSDLVEECVANAMRCGHKDVSMREIQHDLQLRHGVMVDMCSISGRVNELVASKRLVRDKQNPRSCSLSGKLIDPLFMLPEQVRLIP